jgi:nicotinate-nucleotide--dimethylbenzimidazole phosphoribosyltransferase
MIEQEQHLGRIVESVQPVDEQVLEQARERTSQLVMPPRALGRLHEAAERLCGIFGHLQPDIEPREVLVFAADHGVVAEGVTAFPQSVSREMVRCFLKGGAGINALAAEAEADIRVVDIGLVEPMGVESEHGMEHFLSRRVGPGTQNMAQGPAMSREQAAGSVLAGYEVAAERIAQGARLLATGEMGIGNTTAAAAVGCAFTGSPVHTMVGRGTGIDDATLVRKRLAVQKAFDVNRPDCADGLDVLAKVGGFEIGGMAGCFLAGAEHRVPVLLDGFISTAGALLAQALCPNALEYMFAGHLSEEIGHRIMLEHLGLQPLLDLGMRLGEGTGAALAMHVLSGATAVFNRVMTFAEAGVGTKEG